MKRACGISVLLLIFAALLPPPALAASSTFKWEEISKPGARGNLVVSPSEVNEIAVGRNNIIYALDSANSKVYRSQDGGGSWTDITSHLLEAGAVLPATKVAIAPDTPSTIAVVASGGTAVFQSTDGGSTWIDIGVPGLSGTTIQSIAVSPQFTESGNTLREIAVGTAKWGDALTTGQVWVYQTGGTLSSWHDQGLKVDPAHTGGEVSSVAFSPGYSRDKTIIAIASTNIDVAAGYINKTWLCLGKRNTAAGTAVWNTGFASYPAEVGTVASPSGGDAAVVTGFYSSLAIPSSYSSMNDDSRELFVSYDRTPDASDDVYRMDDATAHRLNVNGGVVIDISSIAYSGTITSGKLLAGDVNPIPASQSVMVHLTANPYSSPPTWTNASTPPTGPSNAKVSWSPTGNAAFCGTGQSLTVPLDESAFSTSSDGMDWQQLSLMDTTLKISDIIPSPNGDSLFIATYSNFGPEGIWRTAETSAGIGTYWSRQLTMATTSNRVILRMSLGYASDYTIYSAEEGGITMAVSHNRGNSWRQRRAPGNIVDIAVAGKNTVYVALPGGDIRKSTNDAFTWEDPVNTGLSSINMMTITGQGHILVGGRNGDVAYSTDGGASFTRVENAVGAGDVQIVPDDSYDRTGLVYAAANTADSGIWRGTLGRFMKWEQIDKSMTDLAAGQSIGGLVTDPEGTLYALRTEPASINSGGMTRSLSPSLSDTAKVEFNLVNSSLPAGATFNPAAVFPNALPYLKLSVDSARNSLWSFDTTGETIYRYQDDLSRHSPALTSPGDKTTITAIPRDGGIYTPLVWEEVPGVTKYEVAIYLDPACTQVVWQHTTDTTTMVTTDSNRLPALGPGTSYYWRVRAVEPIVSPWTETWSFTSSLADVWSPLDLLAPSPGASDTPVRPVFAWSQADEATGYEFVLAKDSSFSDNVVTKISANYLPVPGWKCDRDLDYATTYFWEVRAVSGATYSDWVSSFFTTAAKPTVEPPQVIVRTAEPTQAPAPPLPESKPVTVVQTAVLWAAIGTGAVLIVIVALFIVRK